MNKHNDFTETNNATQQVADSHHDTSTIHSPVDSSIDTALKAVAERKPKLPTTSFFTVPSKPDVFYSLNRVINEVNSSVRLFDQDLQRKQDMMKRATSNIAPIIHASRSTTKMGATIKAIAKSTDKIAFLKSSLATKSKLDTLSSLNRTINKVNSSVMLLARDLQRHQEMMKRATTYIDPMMRVALAAQSQMDVAIPSLRTQLKQLKLQPHLSGVAIDTDLPLQKAPYRNVNESITSDNESLNLIDYQPPIHEVFRETGWPGRTRAPAIPKGSSLEELLWELNPDLLNLLQGARQALHTDNRDRVRHVLVSLRELIGHVLRQLAPDDDIRAWNTNPDYYYHKDKPTRKARLLYICREIDSGPLSEFVDKEVSSILALIKELSNEVHAIPCRLTDQQLQWLVNRIESLLLSLLCLNSSNKS